MPPQTVRRGALSHLLVAAQLAGVALGCYPVGLVQRGPGAALGLCLVGAVLGLFALGYNRPGNFSIYPQPKAGGRLVTAGPYRFIRHPMYTSLMLMMAGISLYNGHPLNVAGAALVVIVVVTKALIEERLLAAAFPEFAAYRARTWRFVPLLL